MFCISDVLNLTLRTPTIVVLFLFIYSTVHAGTDDLKIRLLNDKISTVVAGSSTNVIVNISNHSPSDQFLSFRIDTAAFAWRFISDYSSILLEKNSSINKIISIKVPRFQSAGNHFIPLIALDSSSSNLIFKAEIPVMVEVREELQLNKLFSSLYVYAGDTLTIRYSVSNLSNVEVTALISIKDGYSTKNKQLVMQKNASITDELKIPTPKSISHETKNSIYVSAMVKNRPETKQDIHYLYDIFPASQEKFDPYNRYLLKVSGIAAASNRWGKNQLSSMFELSGKGYIDEDKKRFLDLKLRGPNRSGNPLFGLNDEYYINYQSTRLKLVLGDHNYGLSELTDFSRYGRGVEVQYQTKKTQLGAYYVQPRYYPKIKQVATFHYTHRFNPKNDISGGIMAKTDTGLVSSYLLSLNGKNQVFKWLKTDYEAALGQQAKKTRLAYKARFTLLFSKSFGFLNYYYADPGFPGYLSNSNKLQSGINTRLGQRLRLSVNYNINNSNIALDTLFSNAPFNRDFGTSIHYKLNNKSFLNLGMFAVNTKDRSAVSLFNYSKYNARLGYQQQIKSFTLNVQTEVGKLANFLQNQAGESSTIYNGAFNLGFHPNNTFQATAFINYRGGKQYAITGYNRFYFGGSLMANINEKYSCSLQYNSDYELKDYTSDRNLLSFQLNAKLHPKHEINLSANYNLIKNTLDKKEYIIRLRYTVNIGLPVSKKKNIGSLSGRMINKGVQTIQGIRISVDGNKAVTDSEGKFHYPALRTGEFLLNIDESSFDLNTLAETQSPYWVNIEEGKESYFELGITKSAVISGKLLIQEDERKDDKTFLVYKDELDKLLIEATNGKEIYRIFSESDGSFCFHDLRPGKWQVFIYPNHLPPGFELPRNQFEFVLTSGSEEKMEVVIKKNVRQIKFQSQFLFRIPERSR